MQSIRLHTMIFAGALAAASACGPYPAFLDDSDGSVKIRLEPERALFLKEKGAEVIMRMTVEGVPHDPKSDEVRLPVNLAVVLDRSGSMRGEKLEKAIEASCRLIDQLGETDTFSLVAYDTEAEVLIPPQAIENRRVLKRTVRGIRAGGDTALYDGVRLGSRQLDKYFDRESINRVILLSDGQANVGPSKPSELRKQGIRMREQGVGVTTVGLGNNYNEDLMVALAEGSVSNYYFVEHSNDLPGIFAKELGDIRNIVARDIRIQLDVSDEFEVVGFVGYPKVGFKGGLSEVMIGELYSEESRTFLLRCRLKNPENIEENRADLVHVRASYDDRIDGEVAEWSGSQAVTFTDSEKESFATVNEDIGRDLARSENLEVREQALVLADQGKSDEAVALLNSQIEVNVHLSARYSDEKLAREAEDMEAIALELEQRGRMTSNSRKEFQYNNYLQKKSRF